VTELIGSLEAYEQRLSRHDDDDIIEMPFNQSSNYGLKIKDLEEKEKWRKF